MVAEFEHETKHTKADVRIVLSSEDALQLAIDNPRKKIIFVAVGFETTAPSNALSVLHAEKLGLKNYSILTSHVLVPPAIAALMEDEESQIDGLLAAGHVCSIMGYWEYFPLVEKYKLPIVITGFEPLDILQGILMTIKQLESGRAEVENQYTRMVKEKGNESAQEIISKVFATGDQMWRGIGTISGSGYQLNKKYEKFDADKKFQIRIEKVPENAQCIAGAIMKGIKKPFECSQFGKLCTPQNPLGAPMVSSEGACAAYYNFQSMIKVI